MPENVEGSNGPPGEIARMRGVAMADSHTRRVPGSRRRLAVVESAPKGGLLQYAAQLADGLAASGHDVELITARDNELLGMSGGHARMRAVLVAAMPNPSEPPTGWRYLVRRAGIAVRLVRAIARTLWETRRGGYDAVILIDDLNVPLAAAGALLQVALPFGPRTAAICHEPRPRNRWAGEELYVESRLLNALLRSLYTRLDLVMVHGERSRDELHQAWGPVRAAVIPHGDQGLVGGLPRPLGESECILFFGDWRRAKGLPELLQAFEVIEQRRPAATLTIAGTPSPDGDPAAVRAWAARRRDRVEIIDRYVPLEDVPDLFAQARVVAVPYLAGSQSGVLHLAMTAGRPVVGTDVGELATTIIDGVTGRIVPAGDVDALASALEEVLADRELAARWGTAGRRRAEEELSWERVGRRVLEELDSVVARPVG